jgi:hypothetical protein
MPFYTSWLQEVAVLCGSTTTSALFLTEVPFAINYAELRLIRDLDLVGMITTDFSQVTTPNLRTVNNPILPTTGFSSGFVVVNGVNLITPAGQTNPESGKRNPLTKSSSDFLDFAWPSAAGSQLPTLWAIPRFNPGANITQILLGPWPDLGYTVEYIGTQRPIPLSASNQDTFISSFLPDIFTAATMIHFAGAQKNFGAQADNPQMAQSWEAQYEKLLAGADAEQLRVRYMGTSILPIPGTAKQPSSPGAAKQ